MQRKNLFFLSGGILLTASLCANVYFCFRTSAPAASEATTPYDQQIQILPNDAPRNTVNPLRFDTIEYDEYSQYFSLKFSGNNAELLTTDKAPVEVTPGLPCTWSVNNAEIRIRGKFAPETRYHFRVFAGLSDARGGTLDREIVVSGKTPALPPEINFAADATYLPLHTPKLEFIYTTTNIGKINATLSRAFVNNLNAYTPNSYAERERMTTVGEATFELPAAPANTPVNRAFNLESLLKERIPGVYRLELAHTNGYPRTAATLVLTDLAPIATLDNANGRAAVFLRRFSDNSPVAHARISLLSYKNQTVGTGVTDERGYAEIPFASGFDRENDRVTGLLASAGGDLSFFSFTQPHDTRRLRQQKSGQPAAFLFTERGIARPGENFRVSCFLRERADGASAPAAQRAAVLTVRDPNGKVFLKKLLRTDAYGYADCAISLPADALTGNYRLVCGLTDKEVWGTSNILCAMYVPDRIKARLQQATPNAPLPNAPVAYRLTADYYFGTPLDQGDYTFRVSAARGMNPAHWPKDWNIGDTDSFKEPQIFEFKGTLKNGAAQLEYPGFGPRGGVAFQPVRLLAQAAVSEPGGRGVTAVSTEALYPTDWFIALREVPQSYNGEWGFGIRLVPAEPAPDAALAREVGLQFQLQRIDWVYVFADKDGKLVRDWREKRTPVTETTLEPIHLNAGLKLKDYEQTFRFGPEKPLAPGFYELVATSADGTRRTRLPFWHARGEGGVRASNPAVLTFRTDRPVYQPGEIARLTFDAPVAGEGFVVAGERGIENHFSFPVKAGENTVPVPVPAGMESSLFSVGVTVAGRNGAEFTRSFGQALIPVDQTRRHRLQVGIDAPDRARPGETTEAILTLADADGKPQSGKVAVFAVDEGVLALTNYRTPDIFDFFYGEIGGALQFYDVYGMVYPELKILPDGRIGGDGGAGISAKRGDIKFKAIARVLPEAVDVPASGRLKVSLRLPGDHTGALRLMAVAANDRMAGSADRPLVLRDEIGVLLAAPRFLAPGDEAEVTFTLFNHDRDGKTFRFAAILPPTLELASGEAVLQGELAKGSSMRHQIRVRATRKTGADSILWKFQMGDLAKSGSEFITVRGINVPQTRTVFAILQAGQSGDFSLNPTEWQPGARGKIRASGSPALGLNDALDWLNAYPYGCLEQTVAAAFPLLIADDLAAGGILSPEMAEAARPKIPHAYQRLLGMQLTSGGFAMWRGDLDEWRFGSLFAAHFIREAIARKLLRDDPAVTRPLTKFLRNVAENAAAGNRMNRAYACYILALAGDEAAANPARNLLSSRENDYATLLAALALIRKGYAAEAAAPLQAALAAKVWNQTALPFDCADESSRLGMTLYLLLANNAAPPAVTAELALLLGASIKPDGSGWGTTQANGWAALGLGAYAAIHPAEPIQAACRRGDHTEAELAGDWGERPLTPEALTVTNRGRHPLLIQETVTGTPKNPPVTGGSLKLAKRYCDANGQTLRQVRHGDMVYVELQIESPAELANAVIADRLPAGLEIEDERLATRSAALPKHLRDSMTGVKPRLLERGDDRFLIFGDLAAGRSRFVYRTRAVMRGKFAIPPLQAEAMYRPEFNGVFHTGETLEIQ